MKKFLNLANKDAMFLFFLKTYFIENNNLEVILTLRDKVPTSSFPIKIVEFSKVSLGHRCVCKLWI